MLSSRLFITFDTNNSRHAFWEFYARICVSDLNKRMHLFRDLPLSWIIFADRYWSSTENTHFSFKQFRHAHYTPNYDIAKTIVPCVFAKSQISM